MVKSSRSSATGHRGRSVREKISNFLFVIVHLVQHDNDVEEEENMPDLPAYPGMPRWVKICSLIAVFLAVLFVVVHVCGGDLAGLIDRGRGDARHGAPRP